MIKIIYLFNKWLIIHCFFKVQKRLLSSMPSPPLGWFTQLPNPVHQVNSFLTSYICHLTLKWLFRKSDWVWLWQPGPGEVNPRGLEVGRLQVSCVLSQLYSNNIFNTLVILWHIAVTTWGMESILPRDLLTAQTKRVSRKRGSWETWWISTITRLVAWWV